MKIEMTLVVDIGSNSNPDEVLEVAAVEIEYEGVGVWVVESKKVREIEE